MSTQESPLAAQAREHGLTPVGRQPGLGAYIPALWQRRHFLVVFARSRLEASNNANRLGQLWQVLNPLLNAAVYYLVFGVIFDAARTVENFTAFLVTGVFVFGFTQRAIMSGAKSITGNMGLVRALHFPRAVLPLSEVYEELLKTGTSLVVLAVIVLLTGEPLGLTWLQLPFAIGLQFLFSAGIAFVFARLTTSVRDIAQFLPFAMRIWLYLSGVMYPIAVLEERLRAEGFSGVAAVLGLNPAAIYIDLVRGSLMASSPAAPSDWVIGAVWAVAAFVLGFVYFWRAEARYGRG